MREGGGREEGKRRRRKKRWNSRLPREEMCGGARITSGGGWSPPVTYLHVHRLQHKGDFFSCLKPVSTSCRLGTELNARFLNAACGSI